MLGLWGVVELCPCIPDFPAKSQAGKISQRTVSKYRTRKQIMDAYGHSKWMQAMKVDWRKPDISTMNVLSLTIDWGLLRSR